MNIPNGGFPPIIVCNDNNNDNDKDKNNDKLNKINNDRKHNVIDIKKIFKQVEPIININNNNKLEEITDF